MTIILGSLFICGASLAYSGAKGALDETKKLRTRSRHYLVFTVGVVLAGTVGFMGFTILR